MPKPLNDPGWDDVFNAAGQQYDIDPRLLKAMMFVESGPGTSPVSRIGITSPQGAKGPMQLMPSSFPETDWADPTEAIPAAARYLAEGRAKIGDDPAKMLMYYYSGSADPQQWGKNTTAYPPQVASLYNQIARPTGNVRMAQSQPGNSDAGAAIPPDDDFLQFLSRPIGGSAPRGAAAPQQPSGGSIANPTAPFPTGLSAQDQASRIGMSGSLQKAYDNLLPIYQKNPETEQNLRNLSEVFTHFQSGPAVPFTQPIARWLGNFGFDPAHFGLADPAYVEEAKKAAAGALYSTFNQNAQLNADFLSRHDLKPDVELQPSAARSLIAQGLTTVYKTNAQFEHMQDHANRVGSMLNYDPTTFKPDMPGILQRVFDTLPQPQGGKEPDIIGRPAAPPITGLPPGFVQQGTSNGQPVYGAPGSKQNTWVIVKP